MRDPILIDLPSEIRTERLVLCAPQAGDGPAMHAAIVESLPELRAFLGHLPWARDAPSLASAELYCRNAHAKFIARTDLPFLILDRVSGALLGSVGLHRIDWSIPKVEVGYWVRTSAAGQGLISEAVRALTDFAFSHLGAVRVELVTDALNMASRRLAERCQFTLEGTLKNASRSPDGELRDECIYARVRMVD